MNFTIRFRCLPRKDGLLTVIPGIKFADNEDFEYLFDHKVVVAPEDVNLLKCIILNSIQSDLDRE